MDRLFVWLQHVIEHLPTILRLLLGGIAGAAPHLGSLSLFSG